MGTHTHRGERSTLVWYSRVAATLALLMTTLLACGPPPAPAEAPGDEGAGPDPSDGGPPGGGEGGEGGEGGGPTFENPPRREALMRTVPGGFELLTEDGWRPFFLNGINLGLARPGYDPGELPDNRADIRAWLEYCGELGVNSVRLYTLQMPEFYEEFLLYQQRHPDRPLWLVQGIWLDEAQTGDYIAQTDVFVDDIRKTIDAIHGNADIDLRFGKAFGTYRADVSSYTISYLVGRELDPYVVQSTNEWNAGYHEFYGDYLATQAGSPMEAWITEMMDYVLGYSHGKYGSLRTISFSSWPTLDPLVHEIQPKDPLVSAEDFVDIDLTHVTLGPENFAGLYVSYHAYPYYPEFILYTPEYEAFSDAYGVNTYLGYLADLRAYYGDLPVVIAEYGVPSSRGVGKYVSSGMHQGDHGEVDQGFYNARMFHNIVDSDCAGAILFALKDEWFKTAWVVERMELPTERRRTWKNVQNPEQNFGLIGSDPDEPGTRVIDGDVGDWSGAPLLEQSSDSLKALWVSHDAAYVYLRLDVDPGQLDFDSTAYYIGVDTVSREAGDWRLPDGIEPPLTHGVEFVVRLDGIDSAELLVDRPYDTYGWWFWELQDHQLLRSVPNDDGEYSPIFTLVNYEFFYEGELLGPRIDQWSGKLRHGDGTVEASLFSSPTDWQVNWALGSIEVRLPWGLLNFTDPSQREVLFDDRDTPPTEVRATDGLAFTVVAATRGSSGAPAVQLDRMPKQGHSPVYSWAPWERPLYRERKKASFPIFRDAIRDRFATGAGPYVGPPTYLPPDE